MGRKQTFAPQKAMSALPRKRTCAVQLRTGLLRACHKAAVVGEAEVGRIVGVLVGVEQALRVATARPELPMHSPSESSL